MTAEVLLEIEGLSQRFGAVHALSDVHLRLRAGEFTGLVGPNGAGKSTLMSVLTGKLRPTEGSVRVAGVHVHTHTREALRHLGIVYEYPALLTHLSAREMLDMVAQLRGGGDIEAALALAGLGEDAERPIAGYSQGMARRTAIAAAWVSRPELLVLDEALNGLDPASVLRTTQALREHADAGGAVLVSTHVADVLASADRILVLRAGKLVADVQSSTLDDAARKRLLLYGDLDG